MENFVITINRTYGSGGKRIGKMLAESLGVEYYDRDILRLASDDSGINPDLFAKADAKAAKSSSLFKTAKSVYTGEIIAPDKGGFISDKNLFSYQAKIIKELAKKESFVAIGRAADFVLRDYENVVKVFIYAPFDDCVNFLQKYEGKTEKDAAALINKIDKERGNYYKYFTGKDWTDAENYDLCLNSAAIGFDKCVEAIKAFMKLKLN